jgi:hypothetical protein
MSFSKASVVGSSRNTSSARVVVIVAANIRIEGVVLTSPERDSKVSLYLCVKVTQGNGGDTGKR